MVISCSEYGCGASWSVPDEEVQGQIDRGLLVVRANPHAGYSTIQTVGVCKSCQDKFKHAARSARRKRDVDAEHGRLMHLIAQTREAHPDWPLEKCVRDCVAFVNSPAEERDPAFRAYLMDREEHDS